MPCNPSSERCFLDTGELARKVVDLASEGQASDILLLDLRPLETFTDYFVFMSAETNRQMQALQEELMRGLKGYGSRRYGVEGNSQSGWILLDYGDLIIHIFDEEHREYYQLEQLWSHAREVIRIQ
jgi:ribosome-associated protein